MTTHGKNAFYQENYLKFLAPSDRGRINRTLNPDEWLRTPQIPYAQAPAAAT
jgi:hypothetical protein